MIVILRVLFLMPKVTLEFFHEVVMAGCVNYNNILQHLGTFDEMVVLVIFPHNNN